MAMHVGTIVVCVVLLISYTVLLFYGVQSPTPDRLPGKVMRMKSKPHTDEMQQGWESDFLGSVSAERARESLRILTSAPHMAGSDNDLKLAEYMKEEMLNVGVPDVKLEPVEALLSYPISRSLSLMEDGEDGQGRVAFEAPLAEEVYVEDATSDTIWRNKTYLAYSPSGEATAKLVYANYGRKEDYDTLMAAGVNVKGKIVIARYGKIFRGLIVINAEQRGAVGVLIYSDPGVDGFGKGGEYPDKGGWRPRSGVQRGCVLDTHRCPGDPSRATRKNATTEDVCGCTQQELIPAIPALPISWGDAVPLLKALDGPTAPDNFRGGLDNPSLSLLDEYRLGPSTQNVRLKVENKLVLGVIWNVIGRIPGSLPEVDDRPVMIGNHRDAWVFGAVDPNSGTSAMLEVIRGFGGLLKRSWRPRRTLYICSWGGEEFGMIGSVAFAEANSNWISKKLLVYLNVDSGVSGPYIKVRTTPSLIPLWNNTLADIPEINVRDNVSYTNDETSTRVPTWNGQIQQLGSGSDFVAFLHHFGVPCMYFGFVATPEVSDLYGVYHSIYDSFTWMEKYGDPLFERHATLARMWGLLALRLTDGTTVPMDPTVHAKYILSYVDKISYDLDSVIPPALRNSSSQLVELSDAEKRQHDMKALLLAPLKHSVVLFAFAAALLLDQARMEQSTKGNVSVHTNDALSLYHRQFLTKDGLPQRKWFKYVLLAPSASYGGAPLPGVKWAIDELSDEGISDKGLFVLMNNVHIASSRITAAAMYMMASISHKNDESTQLKPFFDILNSVADMR